MIDILIPTYNRAYFLEKNILLLDKQLCQAHLVGSFRLLVSNNCSTDNTKEILASIRTRTKVDIKIYDQVENIGPERNCIFLLKKSDSDYVMYLGDDDYLPPGYLGFVHQKVENERDVDCIIPGFSGLHQNGEVTEARNASFSIMKYARGPSTVRSLSNFGHQLSGLVTKRKGLVENYLQNESLRNIYPFIFFVSYCMLNGFTYYAPMYQVLVSQGNDKNWGYDDSGLMIDVLRNYQILYPDARFSRLFVSAAFVLHQSWRLGIGKNPFLAIRALIHLVKAGEVDSLFKLSLLVLYPYLYIKMLFRFIYHRIAVKPWQ